MGQSPHSHLIVETHSFQIGPSQEGMDADEVDLDLIEKLLIHKCGEDSPESSDLCNQVLFEALLLSIVYVLLPPVVLPFAAAENQSFWLCREMWIRSSHSPV